MIADKPEIANQTTDELDLLDLLERFALFLRKHRFLFLAALVAGILLGTTNYYFSGKSYRSRLILHSPILTNEEQIEIIDNWNELLRRGDYGTLAGIMNCPENLVSGLGSIQGSEILKNYSASSPNGFYIDVRVRSNSILPDLQRAIVSGLNNTEFVKQRVTDKGRRLAELIATLQSEIARLDSTKSSIENILSNREKNSSALMVNVAGVNQELIELHEKLLSYQEEFKMNSGVLVLQGFIPFNTPVSMSLRVSIFLGLLVGMSAAFVIAVLMALRDRLKNRIPRNA
jgi:hypothetical protein